METYYFEYRIKKNRPGLLGDISSMLGLLGINILKVNGYNDDYRGFLIKGPSHHLQLLNSIFEEVESVEVSALRHPKLIDLIGLKHGVKIDSTGKKPRIFCFTRNELGIMIDLLGEIVKERENKIIGIRGMPRVGKSEAAIASCVYANKKWVLISSTIIRQNIRSFLSEEEKGADCVYLIDAITTTSRGNLKHKELVKEVMELPLPKIIEHPEILIRDWHFSEDKFDFIFELKQNTEDKIDYENIAVSFSSFDIS